MRKPDQRISLEEHPSERAEKGRGGRPDRKGQQKQNADAMGEESAAGRSGSPGNYQESGRRKHFCCPGDGWAVSGMKALQRGVQQKRLQQ